MAPSVLRLAFSSHPTPAPRRIALRSPNRIDEAYVVISGTGFFVSDGTRERFGPGDVLHVAAGVPHRFEDFSEDFATWAIFVG